MSSHKTDRPRLRAVIVPPGQGKTFMAKRGLPSHIKEADAICDCKETPALRELRIKAKGTQDWKAYDALLSQHLVDRCEDGDVIMIASQDLALACGMEIVGVYVTDEETWIKNIQLRGQLPSKHLTCYREAVQPMKDRGEEYYKSLDKMYEDICSIPL